jgi:SWIM zinc finger
MNAVTKIWVGSHSSLYRFALQFDKMVENIYERESDEDIITINETPQLWSCDRIKTEARKVYTRNNFYIFKEKLRKGTAYRVCELEKDKLYEVRPIWNEPKYEWCNSTRLVHLDKENARANCECKGFKFEGLLCSHRGNATC